MHTNSIDKKLKIAIISTLFLALTISMCALLSNTANAEGAQQDNGTISVLDGLIHLKKDSGEPIEGSDYTYNEVFPTPTLTILKPEIEISGGDEAAYPGKSINIIVDTTSVKLNTLELYNPQSSFTISQDCDLYCVGDIQKNRSTFGISNINFNRSTTIHGPGRLELSGGKDIQIISKLIIESGALEVYTTSPDNASKYAVSILKGLTVKSDGALIAVNLRNTESYGLRLRGPLDIEDGGTVFASGKTSAVLYEGANYFDGFKGSETWYEWFSDADKVTQETKEVKSTVENLNTREVVGNNGLAKTLTNASVSPTPPTPPTPEPVNPEYTTAQTGDNTAWTVLAIVLIAIAGGATCTYVYRRKNN